MIEAQNLAEALWREVRQRYPFLKTPKVEKWADDIDKLQRIDGYDWNLIEAVMLWSQQDPFWRQQVRSGANLRKHFEKLLIRIKETSLEAPRVFDV